MIVIAAHGALWGTWLLGLFWFVPRCERIFRNYNLKLPSLTELVMALTHGVVPLALLVVLVFVLVDGAVYSRLRRLGARVLWSGLMTVAPVFAIILTAVAICDPSMKLLEGLSR
jgi:type II secretory pathway component PulF